MSGALHCAALAVRGAGVKGKQVRILYDLVTVIGEKNVRGVRPAKSLRNWEGGVFCGSISQETCRSLVQGHWGEAKAKNFYVFFRPQGRGNIRKISLRFGRA